VFNRHNVTAMKRRWASLPDDPGWVARTSRRAGAADGESAHRSLKRVMKQKFLAGERIIDCPNRTCPGRILTCSRSIERPGGSGTRVVLRCTRNPEEHEVVVSLEPYTPEEEDVLKSSLSRGERPACGRCGSEMDLGSVESPDGWAKSVNAPAAYYCPWCGVRWVPPVDVKRRAG
jgi:hypothetical protein